MRRRQFLTTLGTATTMPTIVVAQSNNPIAGPYPRLPETTLENNGWIRTNRYTRTSEEDQGEDTGWTDVDIGKPDIWYCSEYTNEELIASLKDIIQSDIDSPAAYLWTARIDPSTLTYLGWKSSDPFGELGEAAVGVDSDVEAEFESQVKNALPNSVNIYPPQPINMQVVRSVGQALLEKLPGGSFISEAKTWIEGPCSGLVTSSGERPFFEKYWIRRTIEGDEQMEYKGIYADWIKDGEFRAVAGAVPWSRNHILESYENLDYDFTSESKREEFEDKSPELEDELKSLMGRVEFE